LDAFEFFNTCRSTREQLQFDDAINQREITRISPLITQQQDLNENWKRNSLDKL